MKDEAKAKLALASGWLIAFSLRFFTFMSRFVLIFVAAALLLPSLALAKRVAPAEIKPVVHQGVRYIAPNDDGHRAYIEARDVQTNKKLWDLTILVNRIDPKLEEDGSVGFHQGAEGSRWDADCNARAWQDLPS